MHIELHMHRIRMASRAGTSGQQENPEHVERIQDEQDPVRRKRYDQGNHECEVLGRGPEAAESAYAWDWCDKNSGHIDFIPVPNFCLDHLPEWCRSSSVLDYVMAICALTVRLRVSYTSRGRPEGYTFSKDRGSDILHTGTGWVHDVVPSGGFCQCPKCCQSSSPCQTWFWVFIKTACHVVFNTEEAQSTKIDFFYDDKTSKFESYWGQGVSEKNEQSDNCTIFFATHNVAFAEQLQRCIRRTEIQVFRPDHSRFFSRWHCSCIIVSHPHGQPKHVTLGKIKLWPSATLEFRKNFVYTTDTCPGSSGAPVLVFEFMELPELDCETRSLSLLPPHSEWFYQMDVNMSAWSEVEMPDVVHLFAFMQGKYWWDLKEYLSYLLLPNRKGLVQKGICLLWWLSHCDCGYLF